VLIPSIDLMGGKIVQLVQGERKALEFENPEEWIERFTSFPLVQLIDLDAAMGRANNAELVESFLQRLTCQMGGGIRSVAAARDILAKGAHRVIVGSALIQHGAINVAAAQEFAEAFGPEKLVFAIDARAGKIAIRGWKDATQISPLQMIEALDPFCCAFLYTHIDTEGLMQGLPIGPVRELRQATHKQLIVAGGISTRQEIAQLHDMGIDAVVGMALYTGFLKLPYTIPVSK
jgi:phosphoribosylformimino-5-aminoimidazole carboxamide ribotide isomerase